MSFLDDLRSINPNDPSSWPLPVKIGGIALTSILMLMAGFWFLIQGELDVYAAATKKEDELRGDISEQEGAGGEPAGLQAADGRHASHLWEPVAAIAEYHGGAGFARGHYPGRPRTRAQFVLFRPEKESPRDFYAELPISIEIRGSYHDLAQFISDVAALPRIVTVGDISVSAPRWRGKGNVLNMSARARTYRYLDDGGSARARRRRSLAGK